MSYSSGLFLWQIKHFMQCKVYTHARNRKHGSDAENGLSRDLRHLLPRSDSLGRSSAVFARSLPRISCLSRTAPSPLDCAPTRRMGDIAH